MPSATRVIARVFGVLVLGITMSMFNKVTKTFQWGHTPSRMETGEIARQSSGAVLVNIDDTVVLATVVAKRARPRPGRTSSR
jgi:polyribonucleotide nucleotidyltransferase